MSTNTQVKDKNISIDNQLRELTDKICPDSVNFIKLRHEIKQLFKEWLEQKNHKLTYLTESELEMPKEMVNLQIVLGLQSCKTKNDVSELLEDLRQHERYTLLKELSL